MLKERVTLPASVAVLGLLSACSIVGPKPNIPQQPAAVGQPGEPGATTGAAPSEEASALPSTPSPGEQRTPPRQAHLNPAATALVEKARSQASSGDFVAAYATLERAQHIDQQNPLVWVEMGEVKLAEGNPVQADNIGHKALQLASGDPASQAQAWRLIADSLKAQGKDPDAAEAQRHADALLAR
jgi:tetratricopeptide (TPR) repeat protein